ncbi:MAG TPA: choice-of-anchor Q domain-containing protein, partial [Gemmataceae bacterium]|nr:choice-of-anchor Q domain-containing protein [Gemmataceae bacterium]
MLNRLSRLFGRKPAALRRRPCLGLEQLEERAVPAVINVNSLADVLNPAPGVVTLRSAIQQVDTGTDTTNTINLTVAGDYKISLAGAPAETDNLAGEFAVTPTAGNLSIINASGGQVTVDGNHLARVFDINPGDTDNPATKFTVTLQGFTITNGVAVDPANLDGPGSSGGGIRDQGNTSLTLDNITLTGNTASADGGGVSMENAVSAPWTLTVNNSVISSNHAGDAGGGIETDGSGKVFVNSGTVISGNTTNNQGGGIWLDAVEDGVGSVAITDPGTGYTTAPTVTFSAPQMAGGTTTTGVAVITGGVVSGVTITNPGSGYTTAPTVTFSAPPAGTTATADANLDFFNSANLTVTGTLISGNAALNTGANDGGGVGNAGGGTVIIQNSTVEYNSTGGIGGGYGFFAGQATGNLQVVDSIFRGNYATVGGGGVDAGGNVTIITSSLIQGNSTAGNGGGIEALGAQLVVQDSTISGNASQGNGGGVEIETTGAGAAASEIVSTTIAFNSAVNAAGGQIGGGIDIGNAGAFTGALTILNDTINGNYAITGGGVANASLVLVGVENTIIAGNNATNEGPDYAFTNGVGFTSEGGNVVATNNNGDPTFTQTGDQTGTLASPLNPLLGPLQNNGGTTIGAAGTAVVLPTEAILRGSPALAKGLAAGAPTTDERGFTRPDVSGTAVDVGAFELQAGAQNVTFYIKTDHSLWQVSPTGSTMLAPPGTILSISAVTDSTGADDVFAITPDHHVWEHTSAGWQFLSSGVFTQISAAANASGNAVVFGLVADGSLWEQNPTDGVGPDVGWDQIAPGGTVLTISAVTDAAGNDDVFVISGDNHLWEHTPAGWQFLSAGSFQQISAGLNTAGQAEVFGVLTNAMLWEYNPASAGNGWQMLLGAGQALSVSTGVADTAFVILANHQLEEFQLGVG